MQGIQFARTHSLFRTGFIIPTSSRSFSWSCKSRNILSVNAMANCERRQPRRKYETVLTLENMNPHIRKMEYAVRGPIVQRAIALEKELEQVKYRPYCFRECSEILWWGGGGGGGLDSGLLGNYFCLDAETFLTPFTVCAKNFLDPSP